MRDLYRRLELGFGADAAQIEAALARCADPELRRRASGVLQDPARRAVYDAQYLALRSLGDLRHALLLEEGAWAIADTDSDFHGRPLAGLPVVAPAGEAPARPRRWWWPFG